MQERGATTPRYRGTYLRELRKVGVRDVEVVGDGAREQETDVVSHDTGFIRIGGEVQHGAYLAVRQLLEVSPEKFQQALLSGIQRGPDRAAQLQVFTMSAAGVNVQRLGGVFSIGG